MKLWQKFCLWPLLFCLFIFLGTGIVFIEKNTREAFQIKLTQLTEEQKRIIEGLDWYVYISSIRDSKRGAGKISGYMKEYMENRSGIQGVYYQVSEYTGEMKPVYSNLHKHPFHGYHGFSQKPPAAVPTLFQSFFHFRHCTVSRHVWNFETFNQVSTPSYRFRQKNEER